MISKAIFNVLPPFLHQIFLFKLSIWIYNRIFSGYVTDVALPANGKYFVSAENDQKVIIWNLNSRVVIHKDIQINVAQLLIIEDFTPHLILGMYV